MPRNLIKTNINTRIKRIEPKQNTHTNYNEQRQKVCTFWVKKKTTFQSNGKRSHNSAHFNKPTSFWLSFICTEPMFKSTSANCVHLVRSSYIPKHTNDMWTLIHPIRCCCCSRLTITRNCCCLCSYVCVCVCFFFVKKSNASVIRNGFQLR